MTGRVRYLGRSLDQVPTDELRAFERAVIQVRDEALRQGLSEEDATKYWDADLAEIRDELKGRT